MGQRLNISIEKNGEVLANAYYHWSAYTGSAAYLTQQICDYFDEAKAQSKSDFELAVLLLQCTGAGICDREWQLIREQKDLRVNDIELNTCNNRNEGLISITPLGIEETERWEEGRVTIELSNEVISFDVCSYYTLEEFQEEFAEYYPDIEEIDFDPFEGLCVSNFWEFEEFIEGHPAGYKYGGSVVTWIE